MTESGLATSLAPSASVSRVVVGFTGGKLWVLIFGRVDGPDSSDPWALALAPKSILLLLPGIRLTNAGL